MSGFIEMVSVCVIVGFWAMVLLGSGLFLVGLYRRFTFWLESRRRDEIAWTLGWDDYGTMKRYIQRSLEKHLHHLPDDALKVERARQEGMEAGATIATKVALRALMAEINRAESDRQKVRRKVLLLESVKLRRALREHNAKAGPTS